MVRGEIGREIPGHENQQLPRHDEMQMSHPATKLKSISWKGHHGDKL